MARLRPLVALGLAPEIVDSNRRCYPIFVQFPFSLSSAQLLRLLALTGLLSAASPRAAHAGSVRVRKGDWLAELVRQHAPGRLWGPGGRLERVGRHNPHIEDPNVISPGEIIYFPEPRTAKGARRGRRQRVQAKRLPAASACPPCPRCTEQGPAWAVAMAAPPAAAGARRGPKQPPTSGRHQDGDMRPGTGPPVPQGPQGPPPDEGAGTGALLGPPEGTGDGAPPPPRTRPADPRAVAPPPALLQGRSAPDRPVPPAERGGAGEPRSGRELEDAAAGPPAAAPDTVVRATDSRAGGLRPPDRQVGALEPVASAGRGDPPPPAQPRPAGERPPPLDPTGASGPRPPDPTRAPEPSPKPSEAGESAPAAAGRDAAPAPAQQQANAGATEPPASPAAWLQLSAAPGLSVGRLLSHDVTTGSAAAIVGGIGPSLNLRADAGLRRLWLARMDVALRTSAYTSPDRRVFQLDDGQVWLPGLQIGLGVMPLNVLELWLEAGSDQRQVLLARATRHLFLQRVWVPQGRMRLVATVWQRGAWLAKVEAQGAGLAAADPLRSGIELGTGASTRFTLGARLWATASFTYRHRLQNTALTQQGEQLLGLQIGLSWQAMPATKVPQQ